MRGKERWTCGVRDHIYGLQHLLPSLLRRYQQCSCLVLPALESAELHCIKRHSIEVCYGAQSRIMYVRLSIVHLRIIVRAD